MTKCQITFCEAFVFCVCFVSVPSQRTHETFKTFAFKSVYSLDYFSYSDLKVSYLITES